MTRCQPMQPSKIQKYVRAVAPRPYESTPEERVEHLRVLCAVAGALTDDQTLLGLYYQEIEEWLGVRR